MWTKPRAKTTARGYGTAHQKLRAALLPQAYGTPCYRCGMPMLPGQALHLDHTDNRTGYGGFSHAKCNLKAGARKGNKLSKMRIKRSSDAARW